ncbi:uncharacterized protein LOC123528455 isoform X2 [Mercenaria mercenaria]|uniref:uncharacterized protein LOC123528455 isoform X2 n=1 Tax=Mercenaria mercenaria TaxID=6596 RepID=UPI00234EE54F|nr:uncharacterized protein LOC123528455 isoform X2 [Mercenaria mercenaria]
MFPTFRRDSKGSVILTDTKAAALVKSEKRQWAKPEKYEEAKCAARRQCREAGGDENQPKQWMGFLRMQWGSFRGETYRWLLENTPGYYGWLVNKLKQDQIPSSDHLFMFKMTLIKYIAMFPEGGEIVELKVKKKAADTSRKNIKQPQSTTCSTSLKEVELGEMDSAADEELVACLERYEGSAEDIH